MPRDDGSGQDMKFVKPLSQRTLGLFGYCFHEIKFRHDFQRHKCDSLAITFALAKNYEGRPRICEPPVQAYKLGAPVL